jgi:hypothetical protein
VLAIGWVLGQHAVRSLELELLEFGPPHRAHAPQPTGRRQSELRGFESFFLSGAFFCVIVLHFLFNFCATVTGR